MDDDYLAQFTDCAQLRAWGEYNRRQQTEPRVEESTLITDQPITRITNYPLNSDAFQRREDQVDFYLENADGTYFTFERVTNGLTLITKNETLDRKVDP